MATDEAGRERLRALNERAKELSCLYRVDALLARAGSGIADRLLREGVIVRPLAGFGMPDHVRITIGTAAENERLVKALQAVRERA